jgi:hypothetical protein
MAAPAVSESAALKAHSRSPDRTDVGFIVVPTFLEIFGWQAAVDSAAWHQ